MGEKRRYDNNALLPRKRQIHSCLYGVRNQQTYYCPYTERKQQSYRCPYAKRNHQTYYCPYTARKQQFYRRPYAVRNQETIDCAVENQQKLLLQIKRLLRNIIKNEKMFNEFQLTNGKSKTKDICSLQKVVEPCRFDYDINEGNCKEFIYDGCWRK